MLLSGGHIGYGVRPSERRKGYATQMLALALERCKGLELDRVLITCDKNNSASAATILRAAACWKTRFWEKNGEITQRYWINL